MVAPETFIKAMQHETIPCPRSSCGGMVECEDVSRPYDRVKNYRLQCRRCGWKDHVQGVEAPCLSWDVAELETIIDEHLLHLQPICPHDGAPIAFLSLPTPRRKARYRITCFYCGCHVEVDWPPQYTKW